MRQKFPNSVFRAALYDFLSVDRDMVVEGVLDAGAGEDRETPLQRGDVVSRRKNCRKQHVKISGQHLCFVFVRSM